MRPPNLKTRIFLDSGDPNETKHIVNLLGFLDGQTTNPTLISKNPEAQKRLQQGEKYKQEEILSFYRTVVEELSSLMPAGSISIEVYADLTTTAEQMLEQGHAFFSWIPNAHIKYPTTGEGLRAVQQSIKEGLRVNMTLCFTQEQAAAVYNATNGAKKGDVYVSPFVGRLDDIGINGMDIIRNITQMYRGGNGHVEVLAASVRNIDHMLYALQLGSDIITAPCKVLEDWAKNGMPMPDKSFHYQSALQPIPYKNIDLNKPWQECNITHDLTTKGIEKFAKDWNNLVIL